MQIQAIRQQQLNLFWSALCFTVLVLSLTLQFAHPHNDHINEYNHSCIVCQAVDDNSNFSNELTLATESFFQQSAVGIVPTYTLAKPHFFHPRAPPHFLI